MTIKGKATSLDIAHLAGVSQPTVSRALRGSPMVNEETRKRIQAIAEQLNYKVDKNASNLRTQHSGTIALLFFEDPTPDDSQINPFFLSMLGSITRACALQSYDLLISFQQLSTNWQADYEDSNKADGLILLGYGDYLESQSPTRAPGRAGHALRALGRGIAGAARHFDRLRQFPGRARHHPAPAGQGRRSIAFLGHASNHYPEFFERYRGHAHALSSAGLGIQLDPAGRCRSPANSPATKPRQSLLERGAAFDAVFAASDLIAIGAMKALHERGLRVPEDVAVAGFDDIPLAAFVNPGLSTVQQDTKLAGQILVETLLALINNEPAASRTIPVKLALRRSSGAG